MSRWFRAYDDALDDPKVQRLSAELFKKAFYDALNNGVGPLASFVMREHRRSSAPAWAKIRARIFARDNFTCFYCAVRGQVMECDHIFPVARGGIDSDDNLTTACLPCNRSKGSKTIVEWMGRK